MHILGVILSLVFGAFVWYMRIRQARRVAGELLDAAGRAKGAVDRHRLRKKTEGSVLTGIQNPAEAAIVLMSALRDCKHSKRAEANTIIRRQAEYLYATEDVTEALTFADRAVTEVPDVEDIVGIFSPLWNETLGNAEKNELLQMANEVASVGDFLEPSQETALWELRQVLRLDQKT